MYATQWRMPYFLVCSEQRAKKTKKKSKLAALHVGAFDGAAVIDFSNCWNIIVYTSTYPKDFVFI